MDATSEFSLDDIVAELDQEYSGKLPENAIRAAQRQRDAIVPRLIELLRKATEDVRAGRTRERNGHLFALFLLTEFKAKEALPAILEAVSLPGDGPFDLFGDAITEDLCRVLAALAVDTPDVIDEMIVNRSLNEYVRWEAVQTYLLWVRDCRLTRDEAVDRLGHYLREAIADEDVELVEGLVSELTSYSPHEALSDIQEAYRLDLVDPLMVAIEHVEDSIAEGQTRFQEELDRCRPTGFTDTVEELKSWASFRDESESKPYMMPNVEEDDSDDVWDDSPFSEGHPGASTTIRNTGPKVGRNDPCPCGSGKKYKQCCRGG
jgi:hypothetical protein